MLKSGKIVLKFDLLAKKMQIHDEYSIKSLSKILCRMKVVSPIAAAPLHYRGGL